MADQTDKFDPAGSSTSTQRSNTLTPSVNLKGSDGKTKVNVPLDNTKQVRIPNTLSCNDEGQQTVGATFSGDGTNKPSSTNFQLQVGNQLNGNYGVVKNIVAGPGIYISNPNGEGTVSISLKPFRQGDYAIEDLRHIHWTVSDLANPNTTDQSMFLASGGKSGIATNQGVAVRSRDGVNWVDINTPTLGVVSTDPAIPMQSSLFPGTGQIYASTMAWTSPTTNEQTDLGTMFGIEGNVDTGTSCCFIGDDLNKIGKYLEVGGAPITRRLDKSLHCFYNTGSLTTNAMFLAGTAVTATYANLTVGSIFRFVDFPTDLVEGAASGIAVAKELDSTGSTFRQAHSNLAEVSFNSYQIIYADSGLGKLWRSVRSGRNAGTWSAVVTGAPPMYGVQYGGGNWVACGDDDTIYTSTNGTTWTRRSTKILGSHWQWCSYGNGMFVIVGLQGRAAYSTDGGLTWTSAQTGTTNDLFSIAFSQPLCRFVAVGQKRTIITVKV